MTENLHGQNKLITFALPKMGYSNNLYIFSDNANSIAYPRVCYRDCDNLSLARFKGVRSLFIHT